MKLKKFFQMVAFVAAMFLVAAVPATAAEVGAKPFIKDEYYLPYQGSKALNLEQFQENPRSYYRSEEAFQMSRLHAERVIGMSLTDDQFIAILQSGGVRAVACSGELKTCGLLSDDCRWFKRQCYTAEKLVEVKVGDKWVDLLSLACLNPIEDKTPQIASPPPETDEVEVAETPTEPASPVHQSVRTIERVEGALYVQHRHSINVGCSNCCSQTLVTTGGLVHQAQAVETVRVKLQPFQPQTTQNQE